MTIYVIVKGDTGKVGEKTEQPIEKKKKHVANN